MPPKRKSQKKGGTQTASQAANEDARESATRETFDVASIPMEDDASTSVSQQRQQALRSPAGRAGRKTQRQATPRGAEAAARDDGASAVVAVVDAATPATGPGHSVADNALQSLVATGASTATADTLLEMYRRGDRVTALCAVLNLISKAAGVGEVELDGDALADGVDIGPILQELYARVPVDAAAYLMANKDAKYKRFRRAFPQLGEKLVKLAWSADILLDGVLLPTLAQWAISMSESKSRSFRHTATVFLLGVLQGLNLLHRDLSERVAVARTKKESSELEKGLEELTRWRDHFFSQAVHQRLRDVAPEIRLCVFQALKGWVLEFKEEFMSNKYLRYFGMPLHDKRPELRAEGLDMIWQALYTVPDAYSRMHLFLQYFTSRLVEMSGDVDVRCAELAIRVVAMMVRGDSEVVEGNELLQNAMIDRVLLTLFDERPTIRTAAGMLLKVFIHCRTMGEESEEEQVKVATELLCSFATTLRTQYRERMPEKYLIDALWTAERLPLLLTEYKPMLEVAQAAEDPKEAVVGLGLLTALLLKMQGRLTLGPVPKDDRRGTAAVLKKTPKVTQDTVSELLPRISEAVGGALCGILEKHRGQPEVLAAVANALAAVDLRVFLSGHHARDLEHILLELRKATLSAVSTDERVREALASAWYSLVFTEYPLRSNAQAHLTFMLTETASQLAKAAGRPTLALWARAGLLSSLISMVEQWPLVQTSLMRQLATVGALLCEGTITEAATVTESFAVLQSMVDTAANCALWQVSAQQTDAPAGSSNVQELLAQVVACLLHSLSAGDSLLRASSASSGSGLEDAHGSVTAAIVSLRVKTFVHLTDLCAMRFYDLPQGEQETLVHAFETMFEYLSAQLRVTQDAVKEAVAQRSEHTALPQLAELRWESSQVEASQMRLTVGIARLFLLKRLDAELAPRVLVRWTQTPSKAVSDAFKSLFHALRDRASDSFQLERDTLRRAYVHCAEVGATPVSVDALYQIGMKLASMHFTATDRYYPAVGAMIEFAASFAASTDPLLLHGAAPYCSKLRAPDALRLVRQVLVPREIFVHAVDPYARGFVAAMRRAAKLEDVPASRSASPHSPPVGTAASGKRTREIVTTLPEDERDDHLLAEIARGVSEATAEAGHGPSSATGKARGGASGARGRMTVPSRVTTEDGWRVPRDSVQPSDDAASAPASGNNAAISVSLTPQEAPESSASRSTAEKGQRSRRPVVNMPSSQELAPQFSADALDNDEVFIATTDYE